MKNRGAGVKKLNVERGNVEELLAKLKDHKQEAVDCLIASRAAYEPTLDGVADVLERSYEVATSKYELLFHREHQASLKHLSYARHCLSRHCVDDIISDQVYIIIRSSNGYVMVAFRGTFTLQDAIQDMKMATVPISYGEGRAHVGFAGRALRMPVHLFMNLARPGERLIFTGHSLGGAVASLTALRVLEEVASHTTASHHHHHHAHPEGRGGGHSTYTGITKDRILCVTFGTAPFANQELATYINSRYRDKFYHLVSRHDFVPRSHNILPKVLFPVAQRVAEMVAKQASHVGGAMRFLLKSSPEALQDSAMQLEQMVRALCPSTGFIDFMRDCIANDEDTLFYGLCGYVLLFNPNADDSRSTVELRPMENMTPGFCTEGKTSMEVMFEHGLGNHYSCILKGLFDMKKQQQNTPVAAAAARSFMSISRVEHSLVISFNGFMKVIMPFMSDPSSAFLMLFAPMLLRLVNNDVPASEHSHHDF